MYMHNASIGGAIYTDTRAMDDDQRAALEADLETAMREVAERHDCRFSGSVTVQEGEEF